jgi:hypothetical protein
MQHKLSGVLMRMLILALLFYLSGCEKNDDIDKRTKNEKEKAAAQPDGTEKESPERPGGNPPAPGANIQLKSSDMIAQSIYSTLGRGKTLRTDGQSTTDITEEFKKNFGGTAGLRLGEIYADAPSTSYLLALTIVAELAARRCMEEINAGNGELCQCNTEENAEAMLKRALPHLNFADPALTDVSDQFTTTCASDPEGAITSLIGSLAFATRL